MAGYAIRAWQWAVLLQLLFTTALPGAQAQLTAADAGTQGSASPSVNGSNLSSRLVSPKSESSRPPNIGPMYRADAIVTGTDMRQRPWALPKLCARLVHGRKPPPYAAGLRSSCRHNRNMRRNDPHAQSAGRL
jgi:hypothetical protein